MQQKDAHEPVLIALEQIFRNTGLTTIIPTLMKCNGKTGSLDLAMKDAHFVDAVLTHSFIFGNHLADELTVEARWVRQLPTTFVNQV